MWGLFLWGDAWQIRGVSFGRLGSPGNLGVLRVLGGDTAANGSNLVTKFFLSCFLGGYFKGALQ